MKHYKPDGHSTVSPYFVVKNAGQFVSFLEKLFDATVKRKFDNPDGSILHVEVQIDDSIIMIGDAGEEFTPNTQLVHVYVPDVDKTFQKATELGCMGLEKPIVREGDPDKRGMFSDYAGNLWSVGTQL